MLKFCTRYQCLQKGVRDFFLFCLEFELFAKIRKDLVSTHYQKPGLSRAQDLNKIKQGVQGLQAFCELTVNNEHAKPRFKGKLRG